MSKTDSHRPKPTFTPDFAREGELIEQGIKVIAGVDEAGRGPLAGPVVVAAVILDPDNIPDGLNDSKKLSAPRRETLFEIIIASADYSIVSAPPHLIEKLNIRGATLWAMAMSVHALGPLPNHALIDGRDIPPNLPCPGEAMIKGDSRSITIAAASILAKVTRDRMCQILELEQPDYGFSTHKGYGTAHHMEALKSFGATVHHRAQFAPVKAALKQVGKQP